MPNAAPLVASALGAHGAGAFDVGAACSGFLAALATGASVIDAGRASCVVVIGADFMSRVIDPADRGTSAVFADGAGAVVLVATGETRIGPILIGSEADTERNHLRRPRGAVDPDGGPRDLQDRGGKAV